MCVWLLYFCSKLEKELETDFSSETFSCVCERERAVLLLFHWKPSVGGSNMFGEVSGNRPGVYTRESQRSDE